MNLLISDANILIDFEEGRLVAELFRLPFDFFIPDILFVEEMDRQHGHLLGMGLQQYSFDAAEMMEVSGQIERLSDQYKGPSRNDFFALVAAKREQCPLLTGDMALRSAARQEHIVVHGTMWLVERLVREKIIRVDAARQAYARMRKNGRRLPWEEAELLLVALEIMGF